VTASSDACPASFDRPALPTVGRVGTTEVQTLLPQLKRGVAGCWEGERLRFPSGLPLDGRCHS
jgi:hypothetical protein